MQKKMGVHSVLSHTLACFKHFSQCFNRRDSAGMKQRRMHLVLFSGLLSVILSDSSRLTEYVLIPEYKTWRAARSFCLRNYIDLASVQTLNEWSQINKLRASHLSDSWIGLYDDVNSWRWSFQEERLTYTRWDRDQPDNYGGDQDCVMLHPNGYWRDKSCNLKCVVICQSDEGPVLNADEEMSWKQAQRFCRKLHRLARSGMKMTISC
ncbi:C-type lectin BjL-like [Puntigrus tetrazona]|uniref:C-type lectin BjL-like n=1 Tax=Puntigrus tetrazona TaxID=1606681 RepID=UPI001C8900C3|nr:C-type lectin BjL-like [Puntigrus tetrazona]